MSKAVKAAAAEGNWNQIKHVKSADYAPQTKEDATIPNAVMSPDDTIMEMDGMDLFLKDMQRLAGIEDARLNEYTGYDSIPETQVESNNKAATEKIQHQQANNIQPGSPEWFRLWFAQTGLTGENPFGDS